MTGSTRAAARRRYRSPLRDGQTRVTRATILRAAERLFLVHGYAMTTVRRIAADAGVTPDTVFDHFRSKAGLLEVLSGVRLPGESPDTGPESLELHKAYSGRSLTSRVHAYTTLLGQVAGHALDLQRVVSQAAASDPQIAQLWEQMLHARRRGVAAFVDALVRDELLVTSDRDSLIDEMWAVMSPDTFHLLVRVRGWGVPDWAAWVARSWLASVTGAR